MRRKLVLLMFLLAVAAASCPAYAFGSPDYSSDWRNCLGIVEDPQRYADKVWKSAQRVIDEAPSINRKLKGRHPWFKITDDESVKLFRWLYGGDVQKHQPLAKRVDGLLKKFTENPDNLPYILNAVKSEMKNRYDRTVNQKTAFLKDSDREFLSLYNQDAAAAARLTYREREWKGFWKDLGSLREERFKVLRRDINDKFSLLNDACSETLAVLLWDVRLLRDWTGNNQEGLPELREIEAEIDNSCLKVLGVAVTRLVDQYHREVNKVPSSFKKERAEAVIKALEMFFPQMLLTRDVYRKGFKSHHIRLISEK